MTPGTEEDAVDVLAMLLRSVGVVESVEHAHGQGYERRAGRVTVRAGAYRLVWRVSSDAYVLEEVRVRDGHRFTAEEATTFTKMIRRRP